jgi:hypothetical protein
VSGAISSQCCDEAGVIQPFYLIKGLGAKAFSRRSSKSHGVGLVAKALIMLNQLTLRQGGWRIRNFDIPHTDGSSPPGIHKHAPPQN